MTIDASLARRAQAPAPYCTERADLVTPWLSQITSAPPVTQFDSIDLGRIKQLYLTLPTRDGSTAPYTPPVRGSLLHRGHHLALFPPLVPEATLGSDGTDSASAAPPPFRRRMCAGGRFVFNPANELRVDEGVSCEIFMDKVDAKRMDTPAPKIFLHQKRLISNARGLAIEETRTHVFLPLAQGKHRPSSVVRPHQVFDHLHSYNKRAAERSPMYIAALL